MVAGLENLPVLLLLLLMAVTPPVQHFVYKSISPPSFIDYSKEK